MVRAICDSALCRAKICEEICAASVIDAAAPDDVAGVMFVSEAMLMFTRKRVKRREAGATALWRVYAARER